MGADLAKTATRRKEAKPKPEVEEVEWQIPEAPEPKPLEGAVVPYHGDDKVEGRIQVKDTPRRRETVLQALTQGYSYQTAANRAGISRRMIFLWREKDKAFDAACIEAHQSGIDLMEDEALRRAVVGVNEPVYQGGMLVGHVTKYSDKLLEMNLKARRPEKYRENYEAKDTGGINVYLTEDDMDL